MSYYPNVYANQVGPLQLSGLDANFNFAVDIQSQSLYAVAGGSSNIITATLTPAVTALVSGLTLYIRASSANTITNPTFSPNGLTAANIVKKNNQALAVGDIAGAGHMLILQYDATNTVWELVNPASGAFTTLSIAGNATIAGNAGIGTTAPASRLHVRQDQNGTTRTIIQNRNGTGTPISELTFITGSFDLLDNRYAYIQSLGSSSNSLTFGTGNGAAPVDRMTINASGNVGINTTTPDASALLDVQSTTKGVRMPNMTTTQKNAISSPAAGLMVFDTTLAKLCVYTGAAWQTITST